MKSNEKKKNKMYSITDKYNNKAHMYLSIMKFSSPEVIPK